MSHRAALVTIAAAAVADVVCGLLYAAAEHMGIPGALYCAAGNAVTEGTCLTPATAAGHWINLAEFVLVVPLVGATFSLLTTTLTSGHIRKHVDKRLAEHHESIRKLIKGGETSSEEKRA